MVTGEPQGIIRATLSSLAKILSVKDDQIEDALASEKLVKRTLNRRGLLMASAAAVAAVTLPTGLALSTPEPIDNSIIVLHRIMFKLEAAWDTAQQGLVWTFNHPDGSQIRVAAAQP
jgi:hypothetical protein